MNELIIAPCASQDGSKLTVEESEHEDHKGYFIKSGDGVYVSRPRLRRLGEELLKITNPDKPPMVI